MRSSRSCAIATGCTLDNPLRASRGLSASSRCAEVSKAYSRPVLRIEAPNARVLPPAPAQKSTTISPRLASTSRASSCEPSSCTSIAPRTKASSLVICGLPSMRKPHGEKGVATVLIAARASSFCMSARFSLKELTRKSSPAGWFKLLTKGQNSLSDPVPSCAFSRSAIQSGRLWRCISSKSSGLTWSHLSSQSFSGAVKAPSKNSRGAAKPKIASLRSTGPLPCWAR